MRYLCHALVKHTDLINPEKLNSSEGKTGVEVQGCNIQLGYSWQAVGDPVTNAMN